MAQFNFTLEEKEILDLLSKVQSGAFKALLTSSLNNILLAQAEEQLKAGYYERKEERTDVRNEYRERLDYETWENNDPGSTLQEWIIRNYDI